MKVIDLLNKIANGEEVPEKINFKGCIYYLCKNDQSGQCYFTEKEGFGGLSLKFNTADMNDEIEVIEDKKIKRILTYTTPDGEDFAYEDGDKPHNVCIHSPIEELFIKKINELSDEVNKMKEGK